MGAGTLNSLSLLGSVTMRCDCDCQHRVGCVPLGHMSALEKCVETNTKPSPGQSLSLRRECKLQSSRRLLSDCVLAQGGPPSALSSCF